jgi:hypothetical protein
MKHSVCSSIDGGQTATHIAIATSRAALGRRALLRLDWARSRLAKDFEATIESARAFCAASVMLLVRLVSLVLHDFGKRL